MRTVLRLVTPPTERAVTVNEARRHLRLDHMDDDDIVVAYLQAAEQSLAYVGRALKPASYALDIYGYPHPCIEIPMPPLRSARMRSEYFHSRTSPWPSIRTPAASAVTGTTPR